MSCGRGVLDGDGGKKHDLEVTKAIGEARGHYTKRVERLDQDLETELGIDALPRDESSRKPQYLLYCLEAGLVDGERLQALESKFSTLAMSTES